MKWTILMVVVLASACAPAKFSARADKTQNEQMKDQVECKALASQAAQAYGGMGGQNNPLIGVAWETYMNTWRDCMVSRGYVEGT